MSHQRRHQVALIVLLTLVASSAHSDGMSEPKKVHVVRTRTAVQDRPVNQIRLVPDCRPVKRRLLDCVPRRAISQYAPGVLEVVDGPPPRTRRPYPELFSWPR